MVAQKNIKNIAKVQFVTFFVTAILVYLLGLIQNSFFKGDCVTFFDIGSCDANNIFSFAFKLYLGLIISFSFAHFAFINWSKPYYYLLIIPLVGFGLSDRQVAPVIVLLLILGVVGGVIFSKLNLSNRAKPVGKT